MAREEGVKIAPPVHLTQGHRFTAPALEEVGIPAVPPGRKRARRGTAAGWTLVQARHIYEEAEYVASRIRRLVMEEGYRWREIA